MRAGRPGWRPASGSPSPDADAVHAAMQARSVDADDVLRWPGVPPMFAFRDPDGNGMEIVEQR